MDKTNSKILTLSFATAAALGAFVLHLLIKILAGAFGVVARVTDTDVVRHGAPLVFGALIFLALQLNPRVLVWGDEVVSEIRKVVWPSGKDTTAMTIVVVVFVLIASVIITTFDLLAGQGVNLVVK